MSKNLSGASSNASSFKEDGFAAITAKNWKGSLAPPVPLAL